jgi:RimJ/RimL family protein N-acetyltransferase
VRRIITQGRTIGLENEQTGELVAWCVTYDYGALGMLQTKETHRGKGLGRIAVKLMITKLFKECDYSSQAFCFIEAQNVASMRLFESLGFRKSADSLWAGLTVCPAPPPR